MRPVTGPMPTVPIVRPPPHVRATPRPRPAGWFENLIEFPEATFCDWFRIDIHSVVVDVADDDIEGEEL